MPVSKIMRNKQENTHHLQHIQSFWHNSELQIVFTAKTMKNEYKDLRKNNKSE